MQAIEQSGLNEADWEKLRPLLDEEMCDLSDEDRDAILMRYFEGQPFAAMGAKLGIGESSARMRAERAQGDARGREQCAQRDEDLGAQAGFFFFARCGRVLP